jgi:hypothetical protein
MTQVILVVKFTNQSDFSFISFTHFANEHVKRNTSKGRDQTRHMKFAMSLVSSHYNLINLAKNELPLNYSIISWMR